MNTNLSKSILYGIVDRSYVPEHQITNACQELIQGGADLIQLRAKGHSTENILNWANSLLPLCREKKIPFIINDHPSIANQIHADGLHLGQDDGSLKQARRIVGDEMLIGRSTHSLLQARIALEEGFNYIGFGPLFATPTKQGRPGIGLKEILQVQNEIGSHIPVFCIGGIQRTNIKTVVAHGAKRIVIVSDLLLASNITKATQEACAILKEID